jgi:hypothetical protein
LEVIGEGLISLLIQDLRDDLQRLLEEQAAQIRVFKVFVSPLIKSVVEKNLFRWLRSVCVVKNEICVTSLSTFKIRVKYENQMDNS